MATGDKRYGVFFGNCTVYAKGVLEVKDIGNLPSNLRDWSVNRSSTPLDSIIKVSRTSKIIYYDYNNTKKSFYIFPEGKSVKNVFNELEKLKK
ncbi:MAG: hypothetical protein LBV03_05925 [Fusobacteriales bacterium]|nr:hypothetical protein [Fusobacteriales bacterium]